MLLLLGASGPPPLQRTLRQAVAASDSSGALQEQQADNGSNNLLENFMTTTPASTETIAMTQAFDNSLWGDETAAAAAAATTTGGQLNKSLMATSNNNSNQLEQSFSDWWQEYWSRQPFPSGYTQSSITMLACFISTIIFLIVVGNLLVCIAIFTEKSLKPTQNWFIASLAVSDMLLGLVIMPFSLARELMGFWIFGPLWCDIHEALDVLLSTASINTLCLISLDRYWSITQAVSYLKKRTPRRGAFMIAFVWVFSAAVSLPPLFGWKKPQVPMSVTQQQVINATQQQQQQQQQAQSEAADKRRTQSAAKPAAAESIDSEDEESYSSQLGGGGGGSGSAAIADWRQSSNVIGSDEQLQRRRQEWARRRRRKARASQQQQQQQARFAASSSPLEIPSIVSDVDLIQAQRQQQQQQVAANAASGYAYLLADQPAPTPLQQQQQQQQQQANLAAEYPTCQLSDDVGYVLYSALGSFYIPCAVMIFTYIKIFLAARSRARRAINKQARAAHNMAAGSKKNAAGQNQNQNRGSAGGGRGPGGAGATIKGLTSGRGAKQMLMSGDSTLLLTTTNSTSKLVSTTTGGANSPGAEHQDLEQKRGGARHSIVQSGAGGGQPGGVLTGKLVVIERRKSTVSGEPIATTATTTTTATSINQPISVYKAHPLERIESNDVMREQNQPPLTNADLATTAAATITTSCAKQASPANALNASVSCDGVSASLVTEATIANTRRKPTNESNDSSLITVMSASMAELPQVTRFNFKRADSGQQQKRLEQAPPSSTCGSQTATTITPSELERQKTAILLKAISRAGHELSNENLVKEIEKQQAADGSCPGSPDGSKALDNSHEQPAGDSEQPANPNHSTNETCFMTIEEDSDNFDAQTGRTIMMVASTARQSCTSLTGRPQAAGMLMTMMPASGTGTGATAATAAAAAARGQKNSTDQICTNAACLRRRHERSARRKNSSYCGSSMTINDDEEEEDEDDEEMAIDNRADDMGDGDEDDEDDDDDECMEDDLLTDDCNGYSGSCGLDQYCNTSACTHCRECAALEEQEDDGPHNQDSPSTCNYNSKSTLQDSPSCATSARKAKGKQAATRNHNHGHHHHHHQAHKHSTRAGACSELEGQSLTGDDNLSLTDYYRGSNDDNSSIVGHDVLDATPAEERPNRHHHSDHKRRSIVASAFASMGGGLKSMTVGANNSNQQTQSPDEAVVGRKKSSIGFHLARFGGSGAASQAGGGLLALAAAQSQQQQQQQQQHYAIIGQQQQQPATRNLKTLRQNFFHKLNQLTAKSVAKQSAQQTPTTTTDGGKSSAQSSYGSSYEPSVDYATTSNMPSMNDHYLQETTFGETDDGYAGHQVATLGDASGARQVTSGRPSKLLTIAQQAAKQSSYRASDSLQQASDDRKRVQQDDGSETPGASTGQLDANSNNMNEELEPAGNPSKDTALVSVVSKGNCNNIKALRLDLNDDNNNSNNQANRQTASGALGSDQLALIGKSNSRTAAAAAAEGGQLKRRSDSKGTPAQVGLHQSDQRATGTSSNSRQNNGGGGGSNTNSAGGTSRAYLASDNERHKRKLAKARERRATLILGLIMAAFVCSWLPFFTFYVIRALCHVCRDYISPRFEAFIFWMGYCNSAINPIIYTIFNRDFRKAFRKILFKCL